jgi:hypothetical protein
MNNNDFEPVNVDQRQDSEIEGVTFSDVSDVGADVPDLEQLAVYKQMDFLVRKIRGLGLFIILLTGLVGAGFCFFYDYVYDYQIIIGCIIAEIAIIAFFIFVIIMTKNIRNMEP